MKILIKTVSFTALVSLLVLCGGGNIVYEPPGDVNKARDLANSGWVKYERGDFTGAVQLFNEARKADATYLDSYNGLGWSYFRLHNLILSLFNFRIPIDADSTLIDVQVGYSVSAFEKNEFSESIHAILKVVSLDSSKFDLEGTDDYFFIHDSNITSREVRKILALSYFYSGEFQQAYMQLVHFLDPLTTVDPSAENFPKELLAALEKI